MKCLTCNIRRKQKSCTILRIYYNYWTKMNSILNKKEWSPGQSYQYCRHQNLYTEPDDTI